EGRGCGPNKDYVFLDITHLDPATIMKRLPGIREISIQFAGVDPIKAPIPVVPTAHYQMGGIPTSYDGRVVSLGADGENAVVPGFYAAGECACASVHGANRLGTNSLLDLLVFGKSAGDSAVEDLKTGKAHRDLPADAADRARARIEAIDQRQGGVSVYEARQAIARTMQAHAGVFRFANLLQQGVARILEVEKMVHNLEIRDKSQVWNTARVEALETENLIEVAKATMISAEARKESRGAHVRDDAPDTPEFPNGRNDKEWLKHSLWHREGNRIAYKPVRLRPLTVETIALKTRSY
ncbi:MAG: FAD-binding protein, partial [Zoogloeaceae bacterium]|nr:FAD-binding protein [Zoogloeaceae bacterium]